MGDKKCIAFIFGFALGHKGWPIILHAIYLSLLVLTYYWRHV